MFKQKMQYIIKSALINDKQGLEDLLNEMSNAGWDLYGMHEVERKDGVYFDCIFMRQKPEETSQDFD